MPNKDPKNPQPKSQDVKPASAQSGTVDHSPSDGTQKPSSRAQWWISEAISLLIVLAAVTAARS